MIEKMKFISITGPMRDIDRVVDTYLSKYEIQLEDALSELKNAQGAGPFIETDPYQKELQDLKAFVKAYGTLLKPKQGREPAGESNETATRIAPREAAQTAHAMHAYLAKLFEEKAKKKEELAGITETFQKIVPFIGLNYNVPEILRFQAVKYSFGRMPLEYYQKFMDYVYDTTDTIVRECSRDKSFVYLVYFVPGQEEDKVDAIFASMYFEKIFIPNAYDGTPAEEINRLHGLIAAKQQEIFAVDVQIADYAAAHGSEILETLSCLEQHAKNFEVRKYAALTKHDSHRFYILCGWMSERDANAFCREIEDDERTFCFVEKDVSGLLSKPPTKLRHSWLLRPFELYMQMYGLPSYQEIDPTPLLALTYAVFFGFMFGDVGQGALLLLGGALIAAWKKSQLAGIIARCGLSSILFGFLFGSVFGFEGVIKPLWLNPQKAMTSLPLIGRLNTVFVTAIGIGMCMILLCMLLNVLNGIRQHDKGRIWIDTNGVTGFVFYGALSLTLVLFMTGHKLPALSVLLIMFVLPLLLLFFKEPILNAAAHKQKLIEESRGMFFTQGFFELFETLLSYFSNTLSFVRIGAFAVSHAAMMGVVMMLAGAESGGEVNWLVVVLGNLFVCGMEGLIVGIQVLRLEYYELFSRFYTGGGRAFQPYGK